MEQETDKKIATAMQIGSGIPMAYQWHTNGIPMAYPWHTIKIVVSLHVAGPGVEASEGGENML